MPHKINQSLADLIEDYFRQEVMGKSPHTVKAKINDLKKFLIFYKEASNDHSFSSWEPGLTRWFCEELMAQEYAPATINRHLASLRSFGSWLQEKGYTKTNPTKGVQDFKLQELKPKAPRDNEFKRLRKSAKRLSSLKDHPTSQGFRNEVLFETLAATGLRISELLNLKIAQFSGRKFTNVQCKGGKIRSVNFKSDVSRLLQRYIKDHRVPGSDYLFTSKSGNRLDRRNANRALEKIAKYASAGNPDSPISISAHQLRHRHGFKCREQKDVVFASRRLGHANLNYIGRYTLLDDVEEAEILESID